MSTGTHPPRPHHQPAATPASGVEYGASGCRRIAHGQIPGRESGKHLLTSPGFGSPLTVSVILNSLVVLSKLTVAGPLGAISYQALYSGSYR